MRRHTLLVICLIALVNGAFYIAYMRPDWDVAWSDQAGYKQLGSVLARTGKFTRYPDSPVFVPEVLRTPGYPAFVALFYRLFGVGNDVAVTGAQAVVFALLCVLVFGLARRVGGTRVATVAALATALFAPFAHFAALVLTELWTTFVATAAMLVVLRAVQKQRLRDFAVGGVLLSATTLVRPAFFLLPFFLAFAMPLLARSQRSPRALRGWGLLVVTASLTMLPWFTYNYVNLGQFTLSPAGGIGRGLWEGSWQGVWPGRVQAQLTAVAEENSGVEARVQAIAAESGLDAGPMLQYVHEWRTIHDLWDTPQDPMERARARVLADQKYLRGGDRQHPARSTRAYSAASHQGNVRSLGGGHPDSLQRHQRHACDRHSNDLADPGGHPAARHRRHRDPGTARPLDRGAGADAATHLRDRRASAAALRGASVASREAAGAGPRRRGADSSYFPWKRRFMNASMSDFHSWF